MKRLFLITFVIGLFCLIACTDPTKWDEVSIHIITFDMCGGNFYGDTSEIELWVYDIKFIEYLPIPEKDNYVFGGWFTKKDGLGDEFTNRTRVFFSHVVYAHWIED
jgi:hypothetical protein